MSAITSHQRELLERRISRAICWAQTETYRRDDAARLARAVVEELEVSGFSASAQRRAIDNLVVRLEEREATA